MGASQDISMSKQVNNSSPRLFVVDVLRVVCMIWIICIWHLSDYLPNEYGISLTESAVGETVTKVVLSLFTFISGFTLSKYNFNNLLDAKNFYFKRLKRFYGLYAIAIILFYIIGWYSLKATLKMLLGVGIVNGCAPFTLWYMCMLMVFYALTPILRFSYPKKIYNAIAFIAICLVLRYILRVSDIILLYYCAYALGLFVGRWLIPHLSKISLNRDGWGAKSISALAYGSFCAYLFHRVVFWLVANMFVEGWMRSILVPMSILTCVFAVIVLFVASYGIQYIYDVFIAYIGRNRNSKISN